MTQLFKHFRTLESNYVYDAGTNRILRITRSEAALLRLQEEHHAELKDGEIVGMMRQQGTQPAGIVQAISEFREHLASGLFSNCPDERSFDTTSVADYGKKGLSQLILEVTEQCNCGAGTCLLLLVSGSANI